MKVSLLLVLQKYSEEIEALKFEVHAEFNRAEDVQYYTNARISLKAINIFLNGNCGAESSLVAQKYIKQKVKRTYREGSNQRLEARERGKGDAAKTN